MEKTLVKLFSTIVLLGCLNWGVTSCSSDNDSTTGSNTANPYKIAVISDIHVFDDDKIEHSGEAWDKYLAFDNKLLLYSKAIMEKTIQKIKEENVRYVIISGDLTKDGEIVNHELTAQYLKKIEDAGIDVFVINGNHDISNANSRSYHSDGTTTPIETATAADFLRIYADFGYDKAVSRETNGLSYSVDMGSNIRLIFMDSNIYNDSKDNPHQETAGTLRASTLQWACQQAKTAVAEGKVPIGVMHHGLMEHVPVIQTYLLGDMIVDNYQEAQQQLSEAGMNIIFTGHSHEQDISSVMLGDKTFYDIETGSLSGMCPMRFITIDPSLRTFDIHSWHMDNVAGVDLNGKKSFREMVNDYMYKGYLKNVDYMIGKVLKQMGTSEDQIVLIKKQLEPLPLENGTTVQVALANSFCAHKYGDEKIDAGVQANVDALDRYVAQFMQAGNAEYAKLLQMVKKVYLAFYTDTPSADNDIKISY